MFKKIILIVSLVLFVVINNYAQNIRHEKKFTLKDCNLIDSTNSWQPIDNKNVSNNPFNMIVHLGIKNLNDIEHYCTASFIDKKFLISVRHGVNRKEFIDFLELALPSESKDEWVKFNKDEFKIHYFTNDFDSIKKDVALIELRNKKKLKSFIENLFYIKIWKPKYLILQKLILQDTRF